MDGVSGLLVFLFMVCLVVASFFSSAETAFIGTQKLRLQHLIETGHPKARVIARIIESPEKFLALALLGINFFESAMATIGTIIAISLWGQNLGAALATIFLTMITLIFAEFVPKSLAARHGEKMALFYARPISFLMTAFYPFIYMLNHIGVRFARLFGKIELRPTISEEEFHTLISVGHREGTVEPEAAEMLHAVFEFGDRPVREVMVPRTEVIFVEKGFTFADFLALYAEHPFSRYPVFEEKRDNVVGILAVKDLLMAEAKGTISHESIVDEFIRPTCFAPETTLIKDLFVDMRERRCGMAVVIDEFGGTSGIVSISRIVEEIVGPVGSELAGVEKEYEVIDEHTFQVDGGMRVEDANEEMGLGLPEGDYETVAGFVLHLLKRLPSQGEHIRYKGLRLVITKMKGVKIEEVLVTKEHAARGSEETHAAPPG